MTIEKIMSIILFILLIPLTIVLGIIFGLVSAASLMYESWRNLVID